MRSPSRDQPRCISKAAGFSRRPATCDDTLTSASRPSVSAKFGARINVHCPKTDKAVHGCRHQFSCRASGEGRSREEYAVRIDRASCVLAVRSGRTWRRFLIALTACYIRGDRINSTIRVHSSNGASAHVCISRLRPVADIKSAPQAPETS
jgi:hypothetical protein